MDSKTERKAFVLLSGGLDSTTCLHKAIYDYGDDTREDILHRIDHNLHRAIVPEDMDPITWVEAVSINYGQRHKKEMEYANLSCRKLGIKHTILDVGALLRGDSVMLTDDSRGKVDVPNISYGDIKGVSPTYVPFRNGLMLSALTAQAQKWVNAADPKLGEREAGIYFGAHSEDAQNWAYPDCTPEFIGAMANAIHVGSYFKIRLHTPLQWLMKSEIVELGEKLGVAFEDTWSCYKGEPLHCGICPTCRSRREAFVYAGAIDPTEYAQDIPVAAE